MHARIHMHNCTCDDGLSVRAFNTQQVETRQGKDWTPVRLMSVTFVQVHAVTQLISCDIGLQGFPEVCACHIGIVCQECQLPQCCVHLCGASRSACPFLMAKLALYLRNALHHQPTVSCGKTQFLDSRQHCTWQARVQITELLNFSITFLRDLPR